MSAVCLYNEYLNYCLRKVDNYDEKEIGSYIKYRLRLDDDVKEAKSEVKSYIMKIRNEIEIIDINRNLYMRQKKQITNFILKKESEIPQIHKKINELEILFSIFIFYQRSLINSIPHHEECMVADLRNIIHFILEKSENKIHNLVSLTKTDCDKNELKERFSKILKNIDKIDEIMSRILLMLADFYTDEMDDIAHLSIHYLSPDENTIDAVSQSFQYYSKYISSYLEEEDSIRYKLEGYELI